MDLTYKGRCGERVKKLKEVFERQEIKQASSNIKSTSVTDTRANRTETRTSSLSECNPSKQKFGSRNVSELSLSSGYLTADTEGACEYSVFDDGNETIVQQSDNVNKKIAKSASYVDLRGSVGVKVNLQSGKENTMVLGHEKRRRQSIINSTNSIIEKYNGTKVNADEELDYQSALSLLNRNNIVIIRGQKIGRKTLFGRRLFASMSQNFESKYFIGSVNDFIEVVDSYNEQLLFIEDIFGMFKDSRHRFEEWMPQLDFLLKCINKCNTKVIITTTHEVFDEYIDLLNNYMDIFGNENVIDIGNQDSEALKPDDETKTKNSSSNSGDDGTIGKDKSVNSVKDIILGFAKRGDLKSLKLLLKDHLNIVDYTMKQEIRRYLARHMNKYIREGKYIISLLYETELS